MINDQRFSYVVNKDDLVQIYSNHKPVTRLSGDSAVKFLVRVESLDTEARQQLMAKVTGQYKFGNERQGKTKGRR